jgi:hypothetical protein
MNRIVADALPNQTAATHIGIVFTAAPALTVVDNYQFSIYLPLNSAFALPRVQDLVD